MCIVYYSEIFGRKRMNFRLLWRVGRIWLGSTLPKAETYAYRKEQTQNGPDAQRMTYDHIESKK